ncbi:MAG: hypothetical protein ABR548_04595 [Actinomycetota bacterium]
MREILIPPKREESPIAAQAPAASGAPERGPQPVSPPAAHVTSFVPQAGSTALATEANGTRQNGSQNGAQTATASRREPHAPVTPPRNMPPSQTKIANKPEPKKRVAAAPKTIGNNSEFGIDLRRGEVVLHSVRSWSRLRPARMLITNYRVILACHPGKTRWIPLEQVDDVKLQWRGLHVLVVNCTVERLTLQAVSSKELKDFFEVVKRETFMAKAPGARRHDAGLMQEWADQAGDLWDSQMARVRLWIRRHPVMVMALAASVTGFLKVYAT